MERSGIAAFAALAMSIGIPALGGCGMLPIVAQRTVEGALAPVSTTARIINADLQLLNRTIVTAGAQTNLAARQLSGSINQATATANAARQQAALYNQQMAYAAPRLPRASPPSRGRKQSTKPEEQQPLHILPKETLAKLTERQRGLQEAAQTEALTAQIGEMIYWDLEGRHGSALTESENRLGGYTCRAFVQTVIIDGAEEKASATACQEKGGFWNLAF